MHDLDVDHARVGEDLAERHAAVACLDGERLFQLRLREEAKLDQRLADLLRRLRALRLERRRQLLGRDDLVGRQVFTEAPGAQLLLVLERLRDVLGGGCLLLDQQLADRLADAARAHGV